jgi:hypothetical protein
MPLCEGDDEHEDGAEMLDLGEGVGGNSNPFAASIGNEVGKSKSKTLEKSSRLEGDEKSAIGTQLASVQVSETNRETHY